ncbi:riboflavin synthase subunit alpha [Candidatus Uhrbacteria bacterium]|nr:riboflavin synthase subunit alpha [Candidatus Uhrbacteria bacterium]
MFSGIVQQKSSVVDLRRQEGLINLTIDLGSLAENLKRGASVSVSGVCLTVTEMVGSHITFDVMGETLAKTTIGTLKIGDEVNIERSVQIGDELGGHVVSGHVSGMVKIINLEQPVNNHIVTFECAKEWIDFILPKGFIALDGCSLTIVEVGLNWFTVHLIPETLRLTTFGQKQEGDFVNLELDPMTQAVVETTKRYLAQRG